MPRITELGRESHTFFGEGKWVIALSPRWQTRQFRRKTESIWTKWIRQITFGTRACLVWHSFIISLNAIRKLLCSKGKIDAICEENVIGLEESELCISSRRWIIVGQYFDNNRLGWHIWWRINTTDRDPTTATWKRQTFAQNGSRRFCCSSPPPSFYWQSWGLWPGSLSCRRATRQRRAGERILRRR